MSGESTDSLKPVGVRLQGVEKRFDGTVAVVGLDLNIKPGELMVFLGPSGCGKTTTLNIIAGLEQPTEGDVFFGEERVTDTPPEERNISMVFQIFGLYPHMNVKSNIIFPLRILGVDRDVIEQRVKEVTALLRIDRYLDRRLHELSGGERQRVAIAKALVKRPSLFLLDEPFANLDAAHRRELRAELVHLHQRLRTTMIFVTHDQEEAMSIADEIAVMSNGKLVQVGTPSQIYYEPSNVWIAQFVGRYPINIVPCAIGPDVGQTVLFDAKGVSVHMDEELWKAMRDKAGARAIVLGIRPEFVHLDKRSKDARLVSAEISAVEMLGEETLYRLKVGENFLTALGPSSAAWRMGDLVGVRFDWQQVFVFDAETSNRIIP